MLYFCPFFYIQVISVIMLGMIVVLVKKKIIDVFGNYTCFICF